MLDKLSYWMRLHFPFLSFHHPHIYFALAIDLVQNFVKKIPKTEERIFALKKIQNKNKTEQSKKNLPTLW